MSVNLSTRDLLDPRARATGWPDILARHGVAARAFCLEITESAIMDDPSAPRPCSTACRAGLQAVHRDFGTGYSSLAYPAPAGG